VENLFIPATERSPEIDFRFDANHLALRGEAYPEDAAAFFGPLLKALAAHCEGSGGPRNSSWTISTPAAPRP